MIVPPVAPSPAAVIDHYQELDRFYRALWGEHLHHGLWWFGRESPQVAVEQLVDYVAALAGVRAGDQVCDIGAGYGAPARRLAPRFGARITALTVTPAQHAVALAAAPGQANPDHREQVVTKAAAQGLISAESAATLLPYHQEPTPAGQALLEAVASAMRLPAPDAPALAAPPVPVAERLAAWRAAVMGTPAWTPPPRATPRPSQPSAEPDRLLAEATGGSAPEAAKAAAEAAPA